MIAQDQHENAQEMPKAEAVTFSEGGEWVPFSPYQRPFLRSVHAIRFEGGLVWDCVNGWRHQKS